MNKFHSPLLVSLLIAAVSMGTNVTPNSNAQSTSPYSQLLLQIPGNQFTAAIQTDTTAPATLTPEEREKAISLLVSTSSGVSAAIKGLTPAQLSFKPAPDRWSIQECVQHIAASETTLWTMVETGLQQPANPEKRAAIKMGDTALVSAVEDRSHKNTTFAALEPKNSTYTNAADALAGFNTARTQHIAFVKSTNADLRNHVLELPLGTFDTYQFILLVAAHSQRHTQQIEEVKASAGYPK